MLEKELLIDGSYKKDRIGTALLGKNPTVISRVNSGFVFLMDRQFLLGWCILTAYPQVFDLNVLPFGKRNEFLTDMHILGEAIALAVQPLRLNYSILGNTDNYLHAHVCPRYSCEELERLRKPAWVYPEKYWKDEEYEVSEKHLGIATQIRKNIADLYERHGIGRNG